MPRILNLGLVDELDATAIGEPGQRTFNISAYSRHGTGIVWMEKEQLFNISESIYRALEFLKEMEDPDVEEDIDVAADEVEPHADDIMDDSIEFKALHIEMQYDEPRRLFKFLARGPDPDVSRSEAMEAPYDQEVSFYFSHEHAHALVNRGLDVVAAGRPLCPHCAVPINAGEEHVCERRNGYHPDEASAIARAIEDE